MLNMKSKLKYLKLDKSLIDLVFENHLKNVRNSYYKYKVLNTKCLKLIESFKESYYKRVCQKLSSISASSTSYCSLQERMLNDKKIPVIPPLFHNNNFTSNLKEKSEVFNEHFPKQFFGRK